MLLINWLYYEKTILNFEDIVFLSGKTGEGKSALIDAMQLVILGRTDNSIFNKSANDKTTRDLMGYLKGKYKDGTFKRDKGMFSSHLCMEFEDEQQRIYCFGIVFDISGATRSEMDHRYYMMNQPIPGHCFMDDGTVFNIRRMKKMLDGFQDRNCRFFTTHMDYKNYFRQRMLIKDQRFFDVFKMAVAYTPMMNISEFIVKNVCQEEEDLNLEEMQEEIQDYRQMKEQLETVQQKKAQLSVIHEQYTDICEEQERIAALRVEQKAIGYHGMMVEQKEAAAQYEVYTKGYHKLTQESRAAEEQRSLLEQNIEALRDARKDNAADILERKIQTHLEQQNTLKRDTTAVQQQLSAKGEFLEEQIEQLEEIEDYDALQLEEFDLSGKKLAVRRSIHAAQQLSAFDVEAYTGIQSQMRGIEEHLSSVRGGLRNTLQEQRAELAALNASRQELEAGKKTYPKKLLVLKQELEERLLQQVGKPVEVCILADLFSIQDEAWTNAIEGYIHNQKLNLVVEAEYFMDAYRIYRSIKEEKKLHTYSIVDIAKAKPGKRPDAKTLYDCVHVEREDVRPYVEYLLGRVVCCEEEAALRSYPISITSDCMLYSGYAVSHMNPELYRVPFIGSDSIEKQLQEIIIQQQKLSVSLRKSEAVTKTLQSVQLQTVISDDFIRQLEDGVSKAKEVEQLERKIEELRTAQTPESLQELMLLDQKLDEAKKKKNELYMLQVEQGSRRRKLEEDMQLCNERIQELQQRLRETTKPEQGIPDAVAAITTVDGIRRKQKQLDDALREGSSRMELSKVELISKKTHYNDTFRIALNPNFQCDDYEREYEKHSDNVVEAYIDKCRLAEQKAYECFQNNFFSAINSKIENVRTQIDRLNRSIRKHKFGRSSYEFVCTCNEDYRDYYNLITNKELNGHNLLNTKVYEENEELIHELFDKISSLSSMQDPKKYQELQKEVQMLSRFTTYLKFDILENGNSLRATIGSSSGGETQTPFYVAVLVSLFSVYDAGNDGLQLAIFDEAFDKMDNERIEECIYLLKSLGFQAIIVTPTDKISNLSKVADATLIATTDEKNGQRVSTVQKWSQKANIPA